MAGSEPSVLDLLQHVRFRSPRLLVVKASRAALLVFVGYMIGSYKSEQTIVQDYARWKVEEKRKDPGFQERLRMQTIKGTQGRS